MKRVVEKKNDKRKDIDGLPIDGGMCVVGWCQGKTHFSRGIPRQDGEKLEACNCS